jgi:hypothetical protein
MTWADHKEGEFSEAERGGGFSHLERVRARGVGSRTHLRRTPAHARVRTRKTRAHARASVYAPPYTRAFQARTLNAPVNARAHAPLRITRATLRLRTQPATRPRAPFAHLSHTPACALRTWCAPARIRARIHTRAYAYTRTRARERTRTYTHERVHTHAYERARIREYTRALRTRTYTRAILRRTRVINAPSTKTRAKYLPRAPAHARM